MTGNDSDSHDDRDLRETGFRDTDFRDHDLRARFAALRQEEEARAPEFAVRSRSGPQHHRSRSVGKLIAVAACLVMAALLWLRFVRPAPDRTGKPVASLTEWKAPTDFLLETPGRELLVTVPAIGEWHDYTEAPGKKQKRPQAGKPVSP